MNIQRKCAWAASIALAACLALSEPATAACYSFVKIAKDNDNSPEGTIGVSSAFTPGINKDGLVAFIAHLEGGVDAVLVGEGTGLTTVAKSGSVIHQFTGAPSINARRMVAFAADTGVSAPSIVVADSGVLTVVAPGQGGASPYVAFNDDGAVLYREILGPGDERLVVALSGSSTVLYDTNSGQFGSPPGARGTVFDGAPALNNRGVAAFYASLKSGGSGLFTGSGGRTVTIASTPPADGQPSTGGARPDISDRGYVIFGGSLAGSYGLFVGNGGAVRKVADDGVVSSLAALPAINNSGAVAFDAFVRSPFALGIFTGPSATADKVIATGDTLFGSPVQTLYFGRALNDRGQIAFYYSTNGSGSGVARADPLPKQKCKQ